jgi:hypothetical protein
MNGKAKFGRGFASPTYRNSRMSQSQNQNYVTTDGHSASLSCCQAPSGAQENIFVTVRHLRVCICRVPSLMRGQVCHLQLLLVLASTAILASKSRRTHSQILLSQIRDFPDLEVQVPVFISLRNRVIQLYPQALGCHLLRLAGLRWRYSSPPPHGMLYKNVLPTVTTGF